MKKCTKCGEEKDLDEFSKSKNTADGLNYKCRACFKQYTIDNAEQIRIQKSKRYEENRESILAEKAEYYVLKGDEIKAKKRRKYALDPETMLESRAKWGANNPEKIKELSKKYYKENKTVINAKSREYQKNNPEVVNAACAKRRAIKLQATVSWADLEKIKNIYKESDFMTRSTGIQYHVHHIVPLISDLVCGLHCEQNLAVVTSEENLSLGNRWWPDMP